MAENRKAEFKDGDDKVKKPYKQARKKVCPFCTDKVEHIDYKDGAKTPNRCLRLPPKRTNNSNQESKMYGNTTIQR